MKNWLNRILLIILFLFSISSADAAPFDTGMTTFEQPNGVTFTGRIWGDEFIYWSETEDNYCFVQSADGWYYYATLDLLGEYTHTIYKVGIDPPPQSSYKLERSQTRIDEIKQRIQSFSEAVERSRDWYTEKQAEVELLGLSAVTLNVGVILIEFADVKHFKTTEPPLYRPYGYYKSDFEDMMFSENYWIGSGSNSPHPEEEDVFGSFRDYWHQMSRGKLIIEGEVVNPEDINGVPEWLTADYDRIEYMNNYSAYALAEEAIDKAIDSNWISLDPGAPNYYDKLVVVFAQNGIKHTNLFTYAHPDSHYIQVSERCSEELWSNNDYSFTHMGVYTHEFGHNLGFKDEYLPSHPSDTQYSESYQEDGNTDTYNFDLMSWGIYNGPLRKGSCPATLSPHKRISKDWIRSILITQNLDSTLIQYDFDNPQVYRINPENAIDDDEHFLFESRGRDGFDKYIPWNPNDTINQAGNLLVWYHNVKWVYEPTGYTYTDRSRIINADNSRHWFSQLTDFFPATFNPASQDLNDISVPATTLGILIQDPSGNLGNYRPAHFALNGIEKVGNGSTFINEVRPNQATIKNDISGGWQTVSVGVILSDYTATSVFPTATDSIYYKYLPGKGYVIVDTLENGPGYWVKFGLSQSLIQTGKVLDSINIPVSKGWNLIGSISEKVPYINVCTVPLGMIISMYYYDGGYKFLEEDDSLKPSVGYWLNSKSEGNIILLRDFTCLESEGINLTTMDKFTITDSEGRTQDLYIANIDIDTTLIEMDRSLPPPLPEIDFDARFNYGEFIKAVSVDSGEVDLEIGVQTNAYPLTLNWELNPANGIEYSFISDSGLGKISQITVRKGYVTFSENSQGKIKLLGKIKENFGPNFIPEKFELLQNYPNPFNPSTVIKFSVPEATNVTLTIYNTLGQKVTELVNTKLEAGNYSYQWDAGNVATGMYIYELRTDKFVSVKKMMLMK